MPDELVELWDTAIYKEIASQAFYIAGEKKTQDPGAKALMKELAEEELKHSQRLKDFKERGLKKRDFYPEKVPNLMISEYLTVSETLENAGLQDTLTAAMKHEKQAIEFYSNDGHTEEQDGQAAQDEERQDYAPCSKGSGHRYQYR